MLRQLISKWGVMSIELQNAIDADMAVINEDGTKNYVDIDNDDSVIDMEQKQEEEQPKQPAAQKPTDVQAALFGNN